MLLGRKSIILQSHRQWLVTLYPDVDLELRIGLLTPSSKQTYYSSTLCFHKQSEQFLLLLGERTEVLIMQLFTHLQQLVIWIWNTILLLVKFQLKLKAINWDFTVMKT